MPLKAKADDFLLDGKMEFTFGEEKSNRKKSWNVLFYRVLEALFRFQEKGGCI